MLRQGAVRVAREKEQPEKLRPPERVLFPHEVRVHKSERSLLPLSLSPTSPPPRSNARHSHPAL